MDCLAYAKIINMQKYYINGNAMQGRSSENYLTQKFIVSHEIYFIHEILMIYGTLVSLSPQTGSHLLWVDFSCDKDENAACRYELHKVAK